MSKLSILFVCGNGLGSSFAAQMAAQDVLDEKGIKANLDHSDLSSAGSKNADIIISAYNFKPSFEKIRQSLGDTDIIYLKNIVSKTEINEKITPVLTERGIIK